MCIRDRRNHALNELEHSKVAHEYEQKIIAKKADAFFRDAIVEGVESQWEPNCVPSVLEVQNILIIWNDIKTS